MGHTVVVAHGVVLVLCRLAGIVVNVVQQHHRRAGGPCQQLADNALVGLLPEGNFQVVDAEIHHHKVRLVHQHIGHGAGNAIVGAGAADAAVDVMKRRFGKGIHEPLIHPESVGVAGLGGKAALRDGAAQKGDSQFLPCRCAAEKLFQPKKVRCVHSKTPP